MIQVEGLHGNGGDPFRILSAEFVTSAVKPGQYPPEDLPEVAFAGRSNVGKSSLINALLNRKRLVRTSNTPGRTQLINFFEVNHLFRFVDLPGYGFARVPAAVKKNWGPMIETYLAQRSILRSVVLILDSRRLPDKKDVELIAWLSHNRRDACLVLTKADKLSKNQQQKQLALAAEALGLHTGEFILFSAKTHQGRDALWRKLLSAVSIGHPGSEEK